MEKPMTREQMSDMLADYLGNELSPQDRARFEAALVVEPEFAAEVAGLRRALAALQSLGQADHASAAVGEVLVEPRPRWVAFTPALRYAAVIGLAFLGGFLSRAALSGQALPRPSLERVWTWNPGAVLGVSASIDPRIAEAYVKSSSRSDLGRSLSALAQASQAK